MGSINIDYIGHDVIKQANQRARLRRTITAEDPRLRAERISRLERREIVRDQLLEYYNIRSKMCKNELNNYKQISAINKEKIAANEAKIAEIKSDLKNYKGEVKAQKKVEAAKEKAELNREIIELRKEWYDSGDRAQELCVETCDILIKFHSIVDKLTEEFNRLGNNYPISQALIRRGVKLIMRTPTPTSRTEGVKISNIGEQDRKIKSQYLELLANKTKEQVVDIGNKAKESTNELSRQEQSAYITNRPTILTGEEYIRTLHEQAKSEIVHSLAASFQGPNNEKTAYLEHVHEVIKNTFSVLCLKLGMSVVHNLNNLRVLDIIV